MLSLEESVTRDPEHRGYTPHSEGCPRLPVLMKEHGEKLRKEVHV